jgi:DNA-binding MarR family transcriptional regulator
MTSRNDLENHVFAAARDQGISSVLFRNATSRKLGLSATESECLSFLIIQGVVTPTQLANYTGLTTGSITALLDRLEKARYITRTPNPNDRRGTLIKVDSHYMEVAGQLVAGIQQAHRKLLTTYSKTELEIIADFLTRFTDNVNKQAKEIEQKN